MSSLAGVLLAATVLWVPRVARKLEVAFGERSAGGKPKSPSPSHWGNLCGLGTLDFKAFSLSVP